MKKEIPFWEKSNLTIEEASVYFSIGVNKLRKLTSDEKCPYVLWIGHKCLIKKACFEEYLRKTYSL
jgi:excisionase family DNA binding protein